MSTVVEAAVASIRAGRVVILPTDTVYGLAAAADRPAGRDALYALKGRPSAQPTALVAGSLDALFELVPELREDEQRVTALLPGPYTLVVANPAARFAWLCGDDPAALGVRVPDVSGPAADVLRAVRAVVATSANLPGEPEARTVEEISAELRERVAAVVDGGELPGIASTVLDLTAERVRVLRAGGGNVNEALARLDALT